VFGDHGVYEGRVKVSDRHNPTPGLGAGGRTAMVSEGASLPRALRDEQIEFLHGQATQTCSLDNDDIASRIDNGSFGFDAHMDRMDQ